MEGFMSVLSKGGNDTSGNGVIWELLLAPCTGLNGQSQILGHQSRVKYGLLLDL